MSFNLKIQAVRPRRLAWRGESLDRAEMNARITRAGMALSYLAKRVGRGPSLSDLQAQNLSPTCCRESTGILCGALSHC